MAYAGAITVTRLADHSREKLFAVTIVETEAATASETEIDLTVQGLPLFGRVLAQIAKLDSGTGTTVSPVLGTETDPATESAWRLENLTAAAIIHNQASPPVAYSATSLFHRSRVDAAADNVITTTYYISAGWDIR